MILLAVASSLLFFVTYFTGVSIQYILKKSLPVHYTTNFFETFLFGLIGCFIYFNLLSFFTAINYITLLPLLFVSILTFSKKKVRQYFFSGLSQTAKLFFSKANLLLIIPFTALLFFYWILPPLNSDSGEYHYIAIRWYEQFKIVPGLGNVHGRLAFNPASFIISAAWSFTDLTNQPLYPLNGVIVLLFYTWLLKKIFLHTNSLYQFIMLVLTILLFRVTLINISSPSSDLLSGILLFYCGYRTYELIKETKNSFADYFPVLILACFSVTAKLSAIPSLLIVPFIYFIAVKKDKQAAVIIKSILLVCLIITPWLARNFVLSGYLLYPIKGTNFFHADWTVPHNVMQLDYIFSKYGPRTITVDFFTMQKMNILQLTKVWFNYIWANSVSSFIITLIAFLSPATWLLYFFIKKTVPLKIFMLWCIYYTCVFIWFTNSPEHRFGLSYMALAIGLPLLELMQTGFLKWRIPAIIFPFLFFFICLHYFVSVLSRDSMYPFSINDYWLMPLRDKRYFAAVKRSDYSQTFPSVNLGNGVVLYLPDDEHECLNANGPCMRWQYGEIEMRGNKIEDGFRIKKDEVKKYFPFVEANK